MTVSILMHDGGVGIYEIDNPPVNVTSKKVRQGLRAIQLQCHETGRAA